VLSCCQLVGPHNMSKHDGKPIGPCRKERPLSKRSSWPLLAAFQLKSHLRSWSVALLGHAIESKQASNQLRHWHTIQQKVKQERITNVKSTLDHVIRDFRATHGVAQELLFNVRSIQCSDTSITIDIPTFPTLLEQLVAIHQSKHAY
jgi:hypothetical protein